MVTKDDTRAKDQARVKLESIISMVKRLEHCHECTYSDCDLSDIEICEALDVHYHDNDEVSEDRDKYHNEDEARQAIEEDPLSVLIRSGWYSPGETPEVAEYEILLCTGGPAVRIVGDLDRYCQPDTAKLEYQDWFTPWQSYAATTAEDEALLTYARQFYYGS